MLYKFDQCSGRIQAMPHHDKEFMNFVTASELLVCMDLQYRSETSLDKYFVTIRWYISKPDSKFWRELELALPVATLTTVSIMEKVIVVKVYRIFWETPHAASGSRFTVPFGRKANETILPFTCHYTEIVLRDEENIPGPGSKCLSTHQRWPHCHLPKLASKIPIIKLPSCDFQSWS